MKLDLGKDSTDNFVRYVPGRDGRVTSSSCNVVSDAVFAEPAPACLWVSFHTSDTHKCAGE